MSSKEKLINRIKEKPVRNDIEFNELEKTLEHYGFIKREGKGSHVIFEHIMYKDLYITIPRPHGNSKTVKRVYIKKCQELMEYLDDKEGDL